MGIFCLFWFNFGGRRSKLVRRSKYRTGTRKVTFEGQSWMESSFPCGDRSHSSLLEDRDKVAQACQNLCNELRLEVVASQHGPHFGPKKSSWSIYRHRVGVCFGKFFSMNSWFAFVLWGWANSFTSDCFLVGVIFCLIKFFFDFLAFFFSVFLRFMKIYDISNRNYEL